MGIKDLLKPPPDGELEEDVDVALIPDDPPDVPDGDDRIYDDHPETPGNVSGTGVYMGPDS
jgi:hypothetical protein